jgi:hypothetical protein
MEEELTQLPMMESTQDTLSNLMAKMETTPSDARFVALHKFYILQHFSFNQENYATMSCDLF